MDWQTHEDLGRGVQTKVAPDENPVLIAVFDDGERVTEPTAALQVDEQMWAAEGYLEAKKRYSEDIDYDPTDSE